MNIKNNQFLRDVLFVFWAGGLALFSYSLVYALRKPFTAATFADMEILGINFKILVAIAQIMGYLLAKFIGIKLLSELRKEHRLRFIISFAMAAEGALILFAIIPYPYNFLAMFFNGLSLGCMWGVIFSFIEGRRMTDLLASILGVSIIISSGLAKSVGLFCLNHLEISPMTMPAVIGAIAVPILSITGWLLTKLPEPSPQDIAMKQARKPLDGKQRWQLFRKFSFSLTLILASNFLIIVLRDMKEDFLVDIMFASGHRVPTWLFAQVDSITTLIILVIFGMMIFVRKNIRVIQILLGLVILGSLVLCVTSLFYDYLALSPTTWLLVQGLAMYLVFLSFQTIFFDRFIAAFNIEGNVVFFIALVDAFGYLGTCIMLFIKEFGGFELDWLQFYNMMAVVVGGFSMVAFTLTIINLTKRNKKCQKLNVLLWIGQERRWTTAALHRSMLSSKCLPNMVSM